MRFRVLGSLRVEAGSTVVPVTSPRQRAVLAVLLHANRTVSVAGLVGQVWGESGPATAHSLVQTYIWRLRGLLAGHETTGGQPRIIWQSEGYLPYLTGAGFTPRTTGIPLGDCLADEWVCAFGERGIAGWAADALGADEPTCHPQIPHHRTTN